MKNKSVFLSVIAACLLCTNAFSYNGAFSGTKGKLTVTSTQYFDVIYGEECRESAAKIIAVADSYYEEIADKLNYEPYQRFPVSITKQVECANAFFSLAPYNLIVVYDAPEIEELDMQEKTIEAVFYHELTHAVSLNSKHPFWRGMSWFCDFFTPAGLSLTTFWYEGVTVSFESADKGGRLNSPFFTQMLVEAKLQALNDEKSFPSWRDVTGSRDTYPYGTDAYLFGAGFAQYLQNTYGLDKYADFWKNAGTFTTFSFCNGVFKKTYGKELSDVWDEFYESIPVPEGVIENRKSNLNKKTLMSAKGSVIETADTYFDSKNNKTRIAWFDKLSGALFLDGKKVLCLTGVRKLRFTDDGNKIIMQRFVSKDNIKSEVFEFDLNKKRFKKIPGLKQISDSTKVNVVKNGLNWSIEYKDGSKKAVFNLNNRIIHRLHKEFETEDEYSCIFTWAQLYEGDFWKHAELSRVGRLVIDKNTLTAKLYLQKENNCAGIVEAVSVDKNIYVVTEELYSRPLRKINLSGEFECIELENEVIENGADEAVVEVEDKSAEIISEFKSTKYNPLKYYAKGAKLPLGTVSVYSKDFQPVSTELVGASFISSNPWTNGLVSVSGGWNPVDMTGGFGGNFSSGTDITALSASGSVIFDGYGLNQSYGGASLAHVLYSGRIVSLQGIVAGNVMNGKDKTEYIKTINTDDIKYKEEGLFAKTQAAVQFSTVHKTAPRFDQYAGFYIQPYVFWDKIDADIFVEEVKSAEIDKAAFNTGSLVGLRIPGPFPVILEASLFPSIDYLFSCNAQITFWDWEMHKGIPAISMYMQRIRILATYQCIGEYDSRGNWDIQRVSSIVKDFTQDQYSDLLGIKGELTLAPNTSYFASSELNFGFGYGLFYHFTGEDKNKVIASLYTNIAW